MGVEGVGGDPGHAWRLERTERGVRGDLQEGKVIGEGPDLILNIEHVARARHSDFKSFTWFAVVESLSHIRFFL